MLDEQLGVQVGQLDRVADGLDLAEEPADVGVVDVGHLLQDELLDLGLGHLLVDVAGLGVQQQRVAGAQLLLAQRLGQAYDALLVGVGDDQDAVAVGEQLLEHHDLADLLELERGDDVEGLVEHDLLALGQVVEVDGGADVDAQLATAGEHVDGVVLVALEEGAEAGRRLGQPVDLLLEGDDLVAGLAQGLGEALVLRGHRGQRALGVQQALVEGAGAARGVGEPAAQLGHLGLEERRPGSCSWACSVRARTLTRTPEPPPWKVVDFDPTRRAVDAKRLRRVSRPVADPYRSVCTVASAELARPSGIPRHRFGAAAGRRVGDRRSRRRRRRGRAGAS